MSCSNGPNNIGIPECSDIPPEVESIRVERDLERGIIDGLPFIIAPDSYTVTIKYRRYQPFIQRGLTMEEVSELFKMHKINWRL